MSFLPYATEYYGGTIDTAFSPLYFGSLSLDTFSSEKRIQAPQDALRCSLANSPNMQSFLGVTVGDSSAAILKIYNDELPKPSDGRMHTLAEITALRPCAIVFTLSDAGWSIERDAMADDACWHAHGIVHALIFRNVPEADKDDLGKCDVDFRNAVSDIVDDLIELSEYAGHLACDKITARGPFRTDPKELKAIGDAQVYELIIEWGHR